MSESIIEEFRSAQEREVARVTNVLISGNCKSYAEYLAMCHEIKAYKRARINFDDAVIEFNRENSPEQNEEEEL